MDLHLHKAMDLHIHKAKNVTLSIAWRSEQWMISLNRTRKATGSQMYMINISKAKMPSSTDVGHKLLSAPLSLVHYVTV